MKLNKFYLSLSVKNKKSVNILELTTTCGIKNDIKSKKGSREIAILDKKSRLIVDNIKDGLCINRFRENITIEEIEMDKLRDGQNIAIGSSLIEITNVRKKCFDNCILLEQGKYCPLIKNVRYAKIINGGKITLSDDIKIIV
ncbi:MOSC domain-containing protein [Helicovermis profundi]|uniref:MOSC domain-containing protein n=1 Tax=Helicovermis profundi TaxID=3065157 RepID=A0AAU9EJ01_9FIRM|nr:hypothetical protein HLPR_02150 [Clostridia bacterium S502]